MRSILVFGILCLSLVSYSQWSSTVTLNSLNNYTFTINHFCAVNENVVFTGGHKIETWTSPTVGILYFTLNGGIAWDSLEFSGRRIGAVESPSANVVYFISTELVYPIVGGPYQKKYLHRSVDGGQSWNEGIIDSTSLVLMSKPLSFLNDSTGILRIGNSDYLITRDYGETWIPISLPIHKFSNTLSGDTILLEVQNIYTVNLESLDLIDSMYSAYCVGSLKSFDKYSNILIRAYLAQDGSEQGYPDNNYVAITSDEYPLGNHRVFHFPYLQSISQIHLTPSSIYLLSQTVPIRSIDSGYSFFKQESTEPDASDLVFMNLDFASDLVGYAVTRSSIDNTYKIQKTTNAGGTTTNFITPPLQFVASIDEADLNTSIKIYPNPANNFITISSASQIDNIEIYDLQGRSVLVNHIYSNQSEIQISNLKSGSYFIKIHFGNNIEYRTFIKD